MTLTELSGMFNRALRSVVDIQKCLSVFFVLIFSGLVFLFFFGFVLAAPGWLKLPLLAIPFFVLCYLLMLSGCALCQAYRQERNSESRFFFSKELFLQAAYFFLPLLVATLTIGLVLALISMIKSIPYLGVFFAIVLSFIPFLLNLTILILCVAAMLILFFFTPLLAQHKQADLKMLQNRFSSDILSQMILFVVSVIPFCIAWLLSAKALKWTVLGFLAKSSASLAVLQGLFILIPFAALLTLPVVFFFNFSEEAYQVVDN